MKFSAFLFFATFTSMSFAQVDINLLKDQDLKAELARITSEGQVSLSYKEARIKMFNEIYLEKDESGYFNQDVYCLTKHYRTFKTETPDNEIPDHTVFNTEHTWPQSRFNDELPEEVQKTDLHHLYPTFSKINAERGNYPYADVGEQSPKKLQCGESKLGKALGSAQGVYFEPAAGHKGNVARSLFYFSVRYNLKIDTTQEIFLKMWHLIDPVTEKDRARHEIIAKIQNNRNPFIDNPELVFSISDF